jgi:hypothetical protein
VSTASREPPEIRLVVQISRLASARIGFLLAVGNISTTMARPLARVCMTRGQIGFRRAAKSAYR